MARLLKGALAAAVLTVLLAPQAVQAQGREQPFQGRVTCTLFFQEQTADGLLQAYTLSGSVMPLMAVQGVGFQLLDRTGNVTFGLAILTNPRGEMNAYYTAQRRSDGSLHGVFYAEGGGGYERAIAYGTLTGTTLTPGTRGFVLSFDGVIVLP